MTRSSTVIRWLSFPNVVSSKLVRDIVADFLEQGTESMQLHIEDMKPGTLRAGLRRAIKSEGALDVRLAQRGEETYLMRKPGR